MFDLKCLKSLDVVRDASELRIASLDGLVSFPVGCFFRFQLHHRPISRPIFERYIGRNSADIPTDINRSVMGENDEVLGPAGEGRDDGSYKIDANLLLSKKKKKLKLFYVNYIYFQLSTLFTI